MLRKRKRYESSCPFQPGDAMWLLNRFFEDQRPEGGVISLANPATFPDKDSMWVDLASYVKGPLFMVMVMTFSPTFAFSSLWVFSLETLSRAVYPSASTRSSRAQSFLCAGAEAVQYSFHSWPDCLREQGGPRWFTLHLLIKHQVASIASVSNPSTDAEPQSCL